MFIIANVESPPTLGVLWHVVQVPDDLSLALNIVQSGTLVILMGKVLNNISPRATDCCAAAFVPVAFAQLAYRVKRIRIERGSGVDARRRRAA